jgi:hypothetical protein
MPVLVSEENRQNGNRAMFSGAIRHFPVAMVAVALIAASPISPFPTAFADPAQDQKFFDLLGQKEIPPVDNANSLITSARHACEKLDSGMPVGDLVELVRNNGFNENPLTRLQPQDRITRTIDQFINAAVEAYCPYDKGKIASIAGYRSAHSRVELVSVAVHTGEITPTKPLPVPAAPPPEPQEIQPPPPQQPPPPPHRARPAPPQAPPTQAEPAPPEAPAPEAPAPEAPAAPAPGGGADGGNAPTSPTPDLPAPPGHIRLAP